MQQSNVHESRRKRMARRVGAAGMAVAALLALGACRADGGGYVGEPLPGGPVSVYNGDADFGFNFTCHVDAQDRAVIRGQITYHDSASTVNGVAYPEIRLHGIVDPFFVENVSTCEQAAEAFPDAAQFEGTYRPQGPTPGVPGNARDGRFVVQVFDQGEPGRTKDPQITGDSFSIELLGGAYAAYTRGGYIEGGNVQVRGNSK